MSDETEQTKTEQTKIEGFNMAGVFREGMQKIMPQIMEQLRKDLSDISQSKKIDVEQKK